MKLGAGFGGTLVAYSTIPRARHNAFENLSHYFLLMQPCSKSGACLISAFEIHREELSRYLRGAD